MPPSAGLELEVFEDPLGFADAAEAFLLEREAANNLPLGILHSQRTQTALIRPPHGFLAVGRVNTAVVGIVIWNAGWNAVLSFPEHAAFGAAAGRAARATGALIRGVLAPSATANAFADAWRADGISIREGMGQLIYQLDHRPDVREGGGRLRVATPADRDVLIDFFSGFSREALYETPTRQRAAAWADELLQGGRGNAYLWEDGAGTPVAMAVATGPTPHGIRIGGVYTPPELRGRGYASSAVASLSARLMDEGRDLCFLFTDASNPTSNGIYRRIGYEQVAEVVELRFGPE